MADHPSYMWHMNGAASGGAPYYDAPGVPEPPRQPLPYPRRHSRTASVENFAADRYSYQEYQPVYSPPVHAVPVNPRHSQSYFPSPPVVDPGYGDVGIPIVSTRELPPVVHARPYLIPPHAGELIPAPRNLPMMRSNSIQFRDMDYGAPPPYNAPPMRPLTRTKTLPPPPPHAVPEPPTRMPPPYRPPPEPPGRPSAPKPTKQPAPPPPTQNRPILGLEDAPNSPPQAPPRRRHSQGNLQAQLERSEIPHANSIDNLDGTPEEEDVKISVRDRRKLFDSFSAENLLQASPPQPAPPSPTKELETVSRTKSAGANSRASLGSQDPIGRQFTLACAINDVDKMLSMLRDCPALGQWKDPVTGYSAIHWAARKGNLDVLRALTQIQVYDVNARTGGGYTALHLAAQFKQDDVFEYLAVKMGADASLRDYSGKKPHQYRQKQAATISVAALNRIQLRKTQHLQQQERDPKLLRLGSINVRVKKTAEALNHMIGGGYNGKSSSSPSSKRPHSVFTIPTSSGLRGSTKSLASDNSSGPDDKITRRFSSVDPADSSKVSVSNGGGSYGRKSSMVKGKRASFGEVEEQESDTACGFGTNWQN